MTNLVEIVRRNNGTFYDNRTNRRQSVVPRMLSFLVVSLVVAWVLGTPSDTVVSSVITVQSILVGFGFSVLFFLVSSEREKEGESKSLEDKARRKRLNVLSDELFFNISYYNVATFLSVLLALLFAFDVSGVSSFAANVSSWLSAPDSTVNSSQICLKVAHRFLIAVFFFVLLESVFTFYRIVIRVNFYFDQKRKINSQKENGANEPSGK
ncbi:hypothetical protein [Phaeobacter inhibens]|uniref:hypothetical protein n=1 Tax=Phaeobacter inhibens TaxID=221822 RepID=UPI00295EC93B|nr:hypothetical protein [Phaeobacter inhibens]